MKDLNPSSSSSEIKEEEEEGVGKQEVSSIELVLIKIAYETNHQRFDQNTPAFIRVVQKMHTETFFIFAFFVSP